MLARRQIDIQPTISNNMIVGCCMRHRHLVPGLNSPGPESLSIDVAIWLPVVDIATQPVPRHVMVAAKSSSMVSAMPTLQLDSEPLAPSGSQRAFAAKGYSESVPAADLLCSLKHEILRPAAMGSVNVRSLSRTGLLLVSCHRIPC